MRAKLKASAGRKLCMLALNKSGREFKGSATFFAELSGKGWQDLIGHVRLFSLD